MHIVLVKQTDAQLAPDTPDANAVRRFLFEMLDGCHEKDRRAWRRFVRAMNEAGSGEFFTIKIERQRKGWRHRKHMALISQVFKAQDQIQDFDHFRYWLAIGSGYCDWMVSATGQQFPVARSVSYAECDEDEFIAYHDGVVAFLRTSHAQHYLFPSVSPQIAEQGIEAILQSFERNYDEQAAFQHRHGDSGRRPDQLAAPSRTDKSGGNAAGPDLPET